MRIDLLDSPQAVKGEVPLNTSEQPDTELTGAFSVQMNQMRQELDVVDGGKDSDQKPAEQILQAPTLELKALVEQDADQRSARTIGGALGLLELLWGNEFLLGEHITKGLSSHCLCRRIPSRPRE